MTQTLRNIVLYGLFITPFIPLFVFNSFFFPFIASKGFAFRIIVEILFAVWWTLAIVDPTYRPKKSWIVYAVIIFGVVITAADVFGVNFYHSFWSNFERMEGLVSLLHVGAYFFMLASVLSTQRLWNNFFHTTLVANTVMGLFYAIPQITGSADIHQSADRVDATLGNATYFAVYLLMHIFIALFLMLRSKNIAARVVYGVSIVFQLCLLYFTQTRGVVLGLIGGLFIATVLIALFERQQKKMRVVSISAIIALVVIVVGFIFVKDAAFVKNSPTLHRFAEISLDENFLKSQGRYYVWPMAIEGFKERPLLGWGQENFNYVFNEHYNPNMWTQEQWFDRTHNVVLDWLVAGGSLGLASYLFIFIALLYYIWKGRGESFSITDKSILTGLLAAYFFQNLFVFDNLVSYMLFVIIAAYIYATRSAPEARLFFPTSKPLSQNASYVALIATSIVVVIIGYSITVRPLLANRALLQAVAPEANGQTDILKDLESFKKAIGYNTFGTVEAREHLVLLSQRLSLEKQVPADIKQAVFDYAAEQMEQQIREDQTADARHELFLGSLYGRYGMYEKGHAHIDSALALSPKKQGIMFEKGTLFLAQNNIPASREVFQKAFELDPTNPSARVQFLIVALKTQDIKTAQELYAGFDTQTKIFDDRVVTAFLEAKQYPIVIDILKQRLATNPKNPQYTLSLAAGYLQANDRVNAIATLKAFIALDPAKYAAEGEYYIKEIQAGRNPAK